MGLKYLQLPVNFGALFVNLTDAEAGKLIKAMLRLYETGEEPDFPRDQHTYLFWPVCRAAVLDSVSDYEQQRETKRENGKKGGRPRKQQLGKPVLVEKDPDLNGVL